MSWGLPVTVELGGKAYGIHADYRDILLVLEELNGDDVQQGILNALYIFYQDYESIPAEHSTAAWEALCGFIRCGNASEDGAEVKLIDWGQDSGMIAAEVSKVAGYEIRSPAFMHWFTFMGYFSAIGEGQLATLVSIRSKRARGKKLEKWEQEYYKQNRSRVEFKRIATPAEENEKAALLRLLGE